MTAAQAYTWGAVLLCVAIAVVDPVTLWRRRQQRAAEEAAPPIPATPPLAEAFGIELLVDRSSELTPEEARSAIAQYAWRHSRRAPRARA